MVKRLNEKKKEIRKRRTVLRSATAAPRPPGYVEDDPLITPFDMEWVGEIEPENSAFNEVILKVLASAPKLDTTGFVNLGLGRSHSCMGWNDGGGHPDQRRGLFKC